MRPSLDSGPEIAGHLHPVAKLTGRAGRLRALLLRPQYDTLHHARLRRLHRRPSTCATPPSLHFSPTVPPRM